MVQKNNESSLRKILNESGKILNSVIWELVDNIEEELFDLPSETYIRMDEFIVEVEKLLKKDDIEALTNQMQEYAKDVHHIWEIRVLRSKIKMDYKVIAVIEKDESDAAERLERIVKKHIRSGWKLQGGVSVSEKNSGFCVMTQAMIREEDYL